MGHLSNPLFWCSGWESELTDLWESTTMSPRRNPTKAPMADEDTETKALDLPPPPPAPPTHQEGYSNPSLPLKWLDQMRWMVAEVTRDAVWSIVRDQIQQEVQVALSGPNGSPTLLHNMMPPSTYTSTIHSTTAESTKSTPSKPRGPIGMVEYGERAHQIFP